VTDRLCVTHGDRPEGEIARNRHGAGVPVAAGKMPPVLIVVAPTVPVPASMAPLLTVTAELAIEPLTTSVPALTVVAPLSGLLAVSTRGARADLREPLAPETTPPKLKVSDLIDGEHAVDHVARDGPAGAAAAEAQCAGADRGGAGMRVIVREHQGAPSDLLDRPPAV
jgi:hypothetical protein